MHLSFSAEQGSIITAGQSVESQQGSQQLFAKLLEDFVIEMYRNVFFPWTPASNHNTFLVSNWSMTPRVMISTSVSTVHMTVSDGAGM